MLNDPFSVIIKHCDAECAQILDYVPKERHSNMPKFLLWLSTSTQIDFALKLAQLSPPPVF